MSVLHSKTNSGQVQIRFKVDGRWVVVKARSLAQALKEVDKYKPVYL
jgi:hypothetical protein